MSFGIGSAFSKGPGSVFSEGSGPVPGPLNKVWPNKILMTKVAVFVNLIPLLKVRHFQETENISPDKISCVNH